MQGHWLGQWDGAWLGGAEGGNPVVVAGLIAGGSSTAQFAAQLLVAQEATYSAEVELRPWYVKRGKKIHLFSSGRDADAFLEAQEQADKAIAEAQKTSRRARKRLREKIVTVDPIQTVDIDLLSKAVEYFSLPPLPALLAQQDFERVMQIMAMAQEMQDEEDIELLLLA